MEDIRWKICFISIGLGSPEGVAVDWVSRLIFWTDSSLKRLEVANLDGSLRKVLLDKNIQNPRGIAVNPELGLVESLVENTLLHRSVFHPLDMSSGPTGIDRILVSNERIWMEVNVKSWWQINWVYPMGFTTITIVMNCVGETHR